MSADGSPLNKGLANDIGLCQPIGARLFRVAEAHSPLLAAAGRSCGVDMTRMSRMPASISTESG